jgi:glucose/arabinose dehydrogenase
MFSKLINTALIAGVTSAAMAATAPLRITEVNPVTGQVEVTNIATTTHTLAANYAFSYSGNTTQFLASGLVFGPGESKVVTLPSLSTTDSDLWLFESATMNASTIITGVKYGPASNVGATATAVSAGIWPSTSAFVATPVTTASLQVTKYQFTSPSAWGAGTPNFGAYFGTGVSIADPIPVTTNGNIVVGAQTFTTGLVSPLGVTFPDDGSNRLFVYDQGGTVSLLVNGAAQSPPFLDVSSRLVPLGLFPPLNYDERGLLGFAFHPNFAANPKVYTHTSEPVGTTADFIPPVASAYDHDDVIAEWAMQVGSPNVINPSSRRELLRIHHPAFNHDGGTIRFGPDGKLYFTIGDGGTGDDQGPGHLPSGNAQALGNIFGKMMRIDPDGNNSANGKYGIPTDNPFFTTAGAVKEIYAYGFRNPYTFSFDSTSGQLYLGDAGQNLVEEVDVVTSAGNYGWRYKEGGFFFDPRSSAQSGAVVTIPVEPVPTDVIDPLVQYDHDTSSTVVVGGFVYRGSVVPSLTGKYVCAEFGSFSKPTGRLMYVDTGNVLKRLQIDASDRPLNLWIKGFGTDAQGNLYVCASSTLGPFGNTGTILKITGPSAATNWELYE